MREYKFTLRDVLLLIDYNGDMGEELIISEDGNKDTWVHIPSNSSLLWVKENLDRKVEGLGVYGGKLQIFLVEGENNE